MGFTHALINVGKKKNQNASRRKRGESLLDRQRDGADNDQKPPLAAKGDYSRSLRNQLCSMQRTSSAAGNGCTSAKMGKRKRGRILVKGLEIPWEGRVETVGSELASRRGVVRIQPCGEEKGDISGGASGPQPATKTQKYRVPVRWEGSRMGGIPTIRLQKKRPSLKQEKED